MNTENGNEILAEKLQALLEARDVLAEFSRSHPGEITLGEITTSGEAGETTVELTGPPEWHRLSEAYEDAKMEYEAAIRKDERERIIKMIIDNE